MLTNYSISQLCIGLASLSLGALGFAFIAEYVLMIAPCELCIYQRYIYFILIIISTITICFRLAFIQRFLLFCSTIVVFVGCLIAFYHVGVEQQIFTEPSSCASTINKSSSLTLEEMKNQIYNNITHCSEVSFKFLGISMAGWNGILLLIVFIILTKYLYATSLMNNKKKHEK